MSAPTKAYSFSALNNFETCPKKYWHLAIEKDYKEEEGEALIYGKRVHKALELLVKNGTPLPENIAHMQKYVQKFIDSPMTKLPELQLCIDREYKPTSWKDWKGAMCRAMLDLVLMEGDRALIVDYKTGKMKDDGFTQLKLAAAMLLLHYPELQRISVAYLWTEHNGKMTHATFTREQTMEIWNELLPRVEKFQTAFRTTDYPANPSGLCRKYCIVTSCPYHGQ